MYKNRDLNRTKTEEKWYGSFVVIEHVGKGTCKIQSLETGLIRKVNRKDIKIMTEEIPESIFDLREDQELKRGELLPELNTLYLSGMNSEIVNQMSNLSKIIIKKIFN
ncbi:hypothetical protein HERIO_1589 [Hepatospora eriocheir]|uniref:Uncharacterized protein n=1 Tax=Hepatospora eriocheir TaxID=1081669 RepID=A0A1X0Q9V9_9MICR|nr:hypothetical protein HERIO_1589 [Hepatospora eriocheir]